MQDSNALSKSTLHAKSRASESVVHKLSRATTWALPRISISLPNCNLRPFHDINIREHFLRLNRSLIDFGKNLWLSTLKSYGTHYRTEALQKHQTLSYTFYKNIYCCPRMRYLELGSALRHDEINPKVLGIPEYARSGMIYLFERILITNQSKVHQWW